MSTYDYLIKGIPFDERYYLQDGGGVPPVQGEKRLGEVEIEVTPEQNYERKVKNYYRRKINSPAYREKLYDLGYAGVNNWLGIPQAIGYKSIDIDDIIALRDHNVRTTRSESLPYMSRQQWYDETNEMVDEVPIRANNIYNYPTKRHTIYKDDNYPLYQYYPHEMSHSEVNVGIPNNRLSDKEQKLIRSAISPEVLRIERMAKKFGVDPETKTSYPKAKHNADVYERRADINAMRFELYDRGFYNPDTDEYKIRKGGVGKYEWTKKPTDRQMRQLLKEIDTYHPYQRSKELFKNKKSIIDLMRRITSNNDVSNARTLA